MTGGNCAGLNLFLLFLTQQAIIAIRRRPAPAPTIIRVVVDTAAPSLTVIFAVSVPVFAIRR